MAKAKVSAKPTVRKSGKHASPAATADVAESAGATAPAASAPALSSSAAPAKPAPLSLQQVLDIAQNLRRQGRWREAAPLYEKLLSVMPDTTQVAVRAAVHHNLAVCLLALGQRDESQQNAKRAYALDSRLWQSGVLDVNILKLQGHTADYINAAMSLYAAHGEHAEVVIAAANVTMNYLGDAVTARQMLKPFLQHPTQGREARTLTLMSRLYDRDPDDSPHAISRDIVKFAAQDLQLDPQDIANTPALAFDVPARRSHRVGIMSPMLSASPVHAFCFSTFQQMHQEGIELVFIRRGRTDDWATDAFRSIATIWVDAVDFDAGALHVLLTQLELDELYEMGGWMDVTGLRAVSIKPVPRMVKWVGGQSCTTGLTCFDGFISDELQSPPETARLYSEPLILKDAGYVTYTPPPYLERYKDAARKGSGRWGVISNPLKLSRAFLDWVNAVGRAETARLQPHGAQGPVEVKALVLADQRYANPRVRERVESVLRPVWGDRLSFVVPKGHVGFIETLTQLDGLIDTFPYSCGLTMTEALYVGLDVCFPDVPRELFCERHGWAHVINHQKRHQPPAK